MSQAWIIHYMIGLNYLHSINLRLFPCREKKTGASKKGGEEQAKKLDAKPAVQQKGVDEADAKLSFGRIEIDKGEILSLNQCHAMC